MKMNNKEDREQDIDSRLIEKIALIGPTPDRDLNLAAQGRERFLAEVDVLPVRSSPEPNGWLAGLIGSGSSVRVFNRKFAFSTVLAVIVVGVMLFGGASATAFASQSALPGDALYPVKMGLEQTQISLTNDAYDQAKLHLEFAQRRLDEITKLLLQGRSKDVEFASSEFEFYIQQAMDATQTVMTTDPERGAELSKLVSQALLDYAIALKAVLLEAPDPVKPLVEKALLFSQEGAGDEVEIFGVVESITEKEVIIDGEAYQITDLTEFKDEIAVGDTVKVHVILTTEGTKIVREIELADDLDDGDDDFGDNNNDDRAIDSDNDNNNDNDDNDDGNDNNSEDNGNESEDNENESEDNDNDNESNENDNEDDSEGNVNENENESEDEEIETKSEDKENDNKSEDNENESEDDENEHKSGENDNENNSESDEEEEENENGD
jgi:hypothetical protein